MLVKVFPFEDLGLINQIKKSVLLFADGLVVNVLN